MGGATTAATRRWGLYAPLLVGGAFILSAAIATGGRIAPPIDDAYIFFQFAKNTARGYIMTYTVGEGPTAGCTSLLWMFYLALGWAAGLRGLLLAWLGALSGWALLAATGAIIFRLLRERGLSNAGAAWGAAPFALAGPIPFAYLGSTETGLYTFLIVAALYSGLQRRIAWFAVAATLLAWTRPEGMVLAGVLGIWVLASSGRLNRGHFWLVMIPAGIALWVAFMFATVGNISTNPYYAKSPLAAFVGRGRPPDYWFWQLWGNPLVCLKNQLFSGFGYVQRYPVFYPEEEGRGFGGILSTTNALLSAYGIRPLLWLGGIVGTIWMWCNDRRLAAGTALALAAMVILNAVLVGDNHFFYQCCRYGVAELTLILIIMGLALGRAFPGKRRPVWPAIVAAIIFIPSTLAWGYGFMADSRLVNTFYGGVCRNLERFFEPGATLATHDAGYISYYTDYRIVDIGGLGTGRYARALRNGGGAIFEELERELPPINGWVIYSSANEYGYVPLVGESHGWTSYRYGLHCLCMIIAEPDFRGCRADRAVNPPGGLRPVDSVDIADLASERAHRYACGAGLGLDLTWRKVYADGSVELEPRISRSGISYAVRTTYPRGRVVADGGRLIGEWEEFTMATIPGKDAVLVLRTDAPSAVAIEVAVNGKEALLWCWAGGKSDRWREPRLLIPGSYLTGKDTFRLNIDPPIGTFAYHSFYYWIYQ